MFGEWIRSSQKGNAQLHQVHFLNEAVLEAAAQRQLPILAEEILQSMERWSTAGPSSATLATMLRLYGRSGDLGKACQIFREMPKKWRGWKFKPSLVLFDGLLIFLKHQTDDKKSLVTHKMPIKWCEICCAAKPPLLFSQIFMTLYFMIIFVVPPCLFLILGRLNLKEPPEVWLPSGFARLWQYAMYISFWRWD